MAPLILRNHANAASLNVNSKPRGMVAPPLGHYQADRGIQPTKACDLDQAWPDPATAVSPRIHGARFCLIDIVQQGSDLPHYPGMHG